MLTTRLAASAAVILPAFLSVAVAADDEASAGLPQFDVSTFPSQIFWLLVTFVSMYLVMSQLFLPRIGAVLEQRRNRIADDLDEAAEFKRQAEQAEAEYMAALAEAKAKAAQIAAETRASVDKEIAELEAETEAQLEKELSAAEQRIAATAAAASGAVREAAKEVTKDLVSALIDERPSDDAVEAALSQIERGAS